MTVINMHAELFGLIIIAVIRVKCSGVYQGEHAHTNTHTQKHDCLHRSRFLQYTKTGPEIKHLHA